MNKDTINVKVRLVNKKKQLVEDAGGSIQLAVLFADGIYYTVNCSKKMIDQIWISRLIIPDNVEKPNDFHKYMSIPVTEGERTVIWKAANRFKVWKRKDIERFIKSNSAWMQMRSILPKMVSKEIFPASDELILKVLKGKNGKDITVSHPRVLQVALCELDNEYYAALYDHKLMKGHCEYAFVKHNGEQTRKYNLIINDEEWALISNFFNKNSVFELARINTWTWKRVNYIDLIPPSFVDRLKKMKGSFLN